MNVFSGENSIRDFMDPGQLAYLPQVEIPVELNSFIEDRVRIFAKLMTFTALHNVKAVPGFNMISEADARGELSDVTTIIENSSGNTISAIAVAARLFGVDGIAPIVNHEPAEPDGLDPTSGIYKAKELGDQIGWMNPGQYDNEDNPDAHFKWIGKQIWQQTDGEVSVFCSALGTTGTIIGNSRYLKDKNSTIQVVGVIRAPGAYVPGPRTELLLGLVGLDWEPHVDSITQATNPESYAMSMDLSRRGLYVGPSAGLSLAGLLRYLDERRDGGTLDELRNDKGDIVCPTSQRSRTRTCS